jgi:hypothetical protein
MKAVLATTSVTTGQPAARGGDLPERGLQQYGEQHRPAAQDD